ncbi:ABC transporter permease subunit/CPBP intramembrane protease [Peptostreptococcus anaerobius]|uniref:ABC transporter permease subunit/CPBP intramembrane protease n=1 Tax=Peptostreptococcus anaerobius TaxID=1261 RepID=UPI0028FDCBBF|nr:ABC transporter permease subunit/CPBP intramembrane protease [Peptostreptococcus anaerobius]MDU1175518.1 ABC transporter permease subunit/CPBP intramembrane protease [Peptostreptococcus anaerobius]MDU1234034.1 ABC transporter permease subunit/CPBP intramembrane protease [Peptostreptococcus anaerobius]
MRFNIIKEIFKKEILELVRDKKNLFMMFILPILMYPLLTVGISQVMMASIDDMGKQEIRLLIDESVDKDLYTYIEKSKDRNKTRSQGQIRIYKKSTDEKYIKESIKKEDYDIAIKREENNTYKVFVDTRSDKSSLLKERVNKILDDYKDTRVKASIKSAGLDPQNTLNPISYTNESVAESQEEASGLIGRIIPFMLIMGILSGAVYPAADMIAGEKERGTLETLLTMPIKNIELIAGKYLSVAFTAIISALMNLVSMGLTSYYFYMTASKMMDGMQMNFDIYKMIVPIIITLVSLLMFTLVISAISMCVCSFAKNYKQAQAYLTPLMLVTMIPAYASMIPMLKLDSTTALIPVVNVVMLLKAVFFMEVNTRLAGFVLLSNVAYIAMALAILSKIFKSENILFGSGEGISILNARRNIKPKSMPSINDGILIFALEFVYLLTLGSYIQVSYGTVGILLSQVMMLGIVVLYSWYIRVDFKKVYSLNKIGPKKSLFGVLIWFVAFIAMGALSLLIMKLSPSAKEIGEQLNKVIFGDNMVLNIIAIAVAPAICEEAIFRGFILSAFSNKKSIDKKYSDDPSLREGKTSIMERGSSFGMYRLLEGDKAAIIFSGLLFGILHVYWFKIPTTAILGMFLAIGVKKTNSIGASVIGHFLNNLLALIVTSIGLGIMW